MPGGDLQARERAHLHVGRSFQKTNIFPELSLMENVRLGVRAVFARKLVARLGWPPALSAHFRPLFGTHAVKALQGRGIATDAPLVGPLLPLLPAL